MKYTKFRYLQSCVLKPLIDSDRGTSAGTAAGVGSAVNRDSSALTGMDLGLWG